MNNLADNLLKSGADSPSRSLNEWRLLAANVVVGRLATDQPEVGSRRRKDTNSLIVNNCNEQTSERPRLSSCSARTNRNNFISFLSLSFISISFHNRCDNIVGHASALRETNNVSICFSCLLGDWSSSLKCARQLRVADD